MARKNHPATLLRWALLSSIVLMGLFMIFILFHSNAATTDTQPSETTSQLRVIESGKQKKQAISGRKKVAYAITVTKDSHFLDGALVLGYSAKRVHDQKKGFSSDYDADLVAFVTSTVTKSRPVLEAHGWRVLEVMRSNHIVVAHSLILIGLASSSSRISGN